MKIQLTGASDDLIEIDGDIREEWPAPRSVDGDDGALVAVSDGTLLRVRYDSDGIWRFDKIAQGKADYSKVEGSVSEDTFDVVTLDGDIQWVVLANKHITARARGLTRACSGLATLRFANH